jgi:hypothetical protein
MELTAEAIRSSVVMKKRLLPAARACPARMRCHDSWAMTWCLTFSAGSRSCYSMT